MRNVVVVSSARGCFIEIVHDSGDEGSWIVRRCKKFMWFRKQISSHQFVDKGYAFTFAVAMRRKYEQELQPV